MPHVNGWEMLLGATWKVTMHIVSWLLTEIFEIDELHMQRDVIQTDLIFPMVTFCKTVEYHNQDGNTETTHLSYSDW